MLLYDIGHTCLTTHLFCLLRLRGYPIRRMPYKVCLIVVYLSRGSINRYVIEFVSQRRFFGGG